MTAIFDGIIRTVIVVCLLALSLTSAQAQQSSTAPPQYQAAFKIYSDGQLLGAPRITAVKGQLAAMQTKGPNGYLLRFTLNDPPASMARSSQLVVQTEVFLGEEERWRLVANPTIGVVIGREGSIEIPGRAGSMLRDFKLSVLIREASQVPAAAI